MKIKTKVSFLFVWVLVFVSVTACSKTSSGRVEGYVNGDASVLATITVDGQKTDIYFNGPLGMIKYDFVEAKEISIKLCSINPPEGVCGIDVGIYDGSVLVSEDSFLTPEGWGTSITPYNICTETSYTSR
jgi:hypothetical protein